MYNSTLLKIVILVGLAVCLIYLCQQNAKPSRESFEDEKAEELPETFETDDEDEDEDDEDEDDEDFTKDVEPFEDVATQAKATKDKTLAEGIAARKQLKAGELLPKDDQANAWAKVNPKGKGSLAFKSFIDAGYHMGINTVGQSLRNANLQIRSEPANPQVPVSIWLNSTIGPDTNRRDFSIGCKQQAQ